MRILHSCTCTCIIITYIWQRHYFLPGARVPHSYSFHHMSWWSFSTVLYFCQDDIDYGIRYKQLILIASTAYAVLFTLNFKRALLTVTTINQPLCNSIFFVLEKGLKLLKQKSRFFKEILATLAILGNFRFDNLWTKPSTVRVSEYCAQACFCSYSPLYLRTKKLFHDHWSINRFKSFLEAILSTLLHAPGTVFKYLQYEK